jgi:serine phosphatase RsbU (regulator of sigma subunit)
MAEFHGMVRIASAVHCTPRAILCVLNEHLCQVIAKGSFITATMLLFDTRRRSVSYARAGHTPIIRRTGTEVDNLVPSGLALGLCAGRAFSEALQEYTVRYEPGETFILYSDGVSEAMNGKLEEFGEGRLLDLVSATSESGADSLCNRMLERVEEFRAGAEQNDDITIMVIHVQKDRQGEEATAPEVWDTSLARG